MLAFDNSEKSPAVIKVVGIGGAGMNAVERIVELNLRGVELIAMNTDEQVLNCSSSNVKVSLGNKSSRGLGAGADPDVGRKAAEEVRDKINEVLTGSDMVFITAGMGGGTGTGASPVVAQIAKEIGAVTVGVVTMPFKSEGVCKIEAAIEGQMELRNKIDTLITIPNDSIFKVVDRRTSFKMAFKAIDDVLAKSVIGISDIINSAGDVNVDFADVKTVMSRNGDAVIGVGEGRGDDRVAQALQQAISHPLLEGRKVDGATAVLINIVAGSDLSVFEYNEILETLRTQVSDRAQIINGFREDHNYEDQLSITVIATGFEKKILPKKDLPKVSNSNDNPNSHEIKAIHEQFSQPYNEDQNIDQQNLNFPDIKISEKNFNIPAFLRKKR